jgi:hypothetical protein
MPMITIRLSDQALGRLAAAGIEYNLPVLQVASMILDRTRNFHELLQPTPKIKRAAKPVKAPTTRPNAAHVISMGPEA